MGFDCGIVGLPNVGKSTLFNALMSTAIAQAENYPFCTIEPNIGTVDVPDKRLAILAHIRGSNKIIPTRIRFVDIAGLVRGASHGEGLGNQFLDQIRACDAIIHVLRCFENESIIHVDGSISPLRDIETIETELMLADLNSLENYARLLNKKARSGDQDMKSKIVVINLLLDALQSGKSARSVPLLENPEYNRVRQQLYLLTSKPVLYVCNVDEAAVVSGNVYTKQVSSWAEKKNQTAVTTITAAAEAEIAQLSSEKERNVLLTAIGLSETGLSKLIRLSYKLLNLITFFTIGSKEARAWTIHRGTTAVEAANIIHSDFKKGFIRASVIAYNDFLFCSGEQNARETGKVHLEGREYVVADGDIIHFLFKV